MTAAFHGSERFATALHDAGWMVVFAHDMERVALAPHGTLRVAVFHDGTTTMHCSRDPGKYVFHSAKAHGDRVPETQRTSVGELTPARLAEGITRATMHFRQKRKTRLIIFWLLITYKFEILGRWGRWPIRCITSYLAAVSFYIIPGKCGT